MRLTDKQLEVLRVINEANPDGKPVDLDQLIERLSYKPSKAAIQFSIRALVGHELIEKAGQEIRRGRSRVLLVPTLLGQHFYRANTGSVAAAILEAED